MRCLFIGLSEYPDQVIRRKGYRAAQILDGNGCTVALIQQQAGEMNLLMRVQAHGGFLPAESGHCGYYSTFKRRGTAFAPMRFCATGAVDGQKPMPARPFLSIAIDATALHIHLDFVDKKNLLCFT